MLICAITMLNLETVMLNQISQSQKYCILCDYIYMKYLEQANLQRQKGDWWLPGLGGGEKLGVTAKTCGVSFQGAEKFL